MGTLYSYSRLDSYFQCPLKYKFRYLDKIRVETEGIEAFMGSRAHSALEKLYKDKMMGKENTLEDILDYYEAEWQKNWHEKVQIVKKEYTAENYKAVGAQAVKDYYKRYHPFEEGKTLGLEQPISIDLNGDKKYRLRGFIDRLTIKENNHYEIHDYKTSASLPSQVQFDKDKQLALYQIGVEEKWADAEKIVLVWHFLRHDKEIRSERDAKAIEVLKKELSSQIDLVEDAVEKGNFKPCESALCNWCDYQELCPKRKHIFRVAALPPNEYLKEDGVTLVNKYIQLKEEKKEFVARKEEEMAKVEEALICFAKKEGYDCIAGSEHQVKVNFDPRYTFPTKTKHSLQRQELEKLVRKLGIWDEVSDLSTGKLSAIVNENGLSEAQIKSIKKLLVLDEAPKVSVSKLKR